MSKTSIALLGTAGVAWSGLIVWAGTALFKHSHPAVKIIGGAMVVCGSINAVAQTGVTVMQLATADA